MGPNEMQLHEIVKAELWGIPIAHRMGQSMALLGDAMREVGGKLHDGWTGNAASNAKEIFTALEKKSSKLEQLLREVQAQIERANEAKLKAAVDYANLPPDHAEGLYFDLVRGAREVPILDGVTLPLSSEVAKADGEAARERERAAARALVNLHRVLRESSQALRIESDGVAVPDVVPIPEPLEMGDLSPDFGGGGFGGGQPTPRSPIDPDSLIGFDDPIPHWPGPERQWVGPGPGGQHISVDSNAAGVLPGLGAAGIGAGGGAAALAAGVRIGGSGLGMTGGLGTAGSLGSTGGLASGLNAGGSGVGGSGAAGAAGAGVGGRGGSATGMMGGQGGAGEKEKRRGLGGPLAPKLEDDEEFGPRSAGAGAGGRNPADIE